MAQECKERMIMALTTGMGLMGMEGCRGFRFLMPNLVNQPKILRSEEAQQYEAKHDPVLDGRSVL